MIGLQTRCTNSLCSGTACKRWSLTGVIMNRQKFAFALGLSVVACVWATGCWSASSRPHTCKETLAEDCDEHYHRAEMIYDRDRRALAEDLDLLFLTERPTRLSRWHGK